MTLRISIIIPLFNKSPYVRETLEAWIAQLSSDDEIVVVDDCSTDDGPDKARSLLEPVHGASVTVLPLNSGPGSARNRGARIATGSHLLFFDADDLPAPHLLQSLRQVISTHPDDAVFAYTIAFQARGESIVSRSNDNTPQVTRRALHAFAEDSLAGRTLCTASSTCVARIPFLDSGGFKEGLRYCEDPELWARLSSSYPIVEIHDTLALYRDVPKSLSYGLRGQIGSVNPYVDSLVSLGRTYGDPYLSLARSLLFKNLVFARAAGASHSEGAKQLNKYRSTLGNQKHAALQLLNLFPASLFRWALDRRTRRQRQNVTVI